MRRHGDRGGGQRQEAQQDGLAPAARPRASSRAAQWKPTSDSSPGGRNRVIAAGRKVMVQAKAISMPTPAIRPSSATPENAVGTKARNPAAVASDGTRICAPVQRGGAPHGIGRLGMQESSLAVTDRELDGEIHGDADEQHAESDRDQVQRSHRHRGEQQRQRQAQCQRHQDRHDQPPGAHRQEQPQRDQHHAADQRLHRAFARRWRIPRRPGRPGR